MRNKLLLILFSFMVIISACNKPGKTGLMVPKDAFFVMHINTESLSSKLSWDEIKASKWFGKAREEANDTLMQAILENPAKSGIDTKSDMVLFVKKQGQNGYISVQGKIIDQKAFEDLLKKVTGTTEVKKAGDISYLTKNDGLMSWTSTSFNFIGDVPMPDYSKGFSGMNNGTVQKLSPDSLVFIAQSIKGLEGSELLDSDAKFSELIKSKGDVHFWFNAEKAYGDMGGGFMSMMKLGDLIKGNIGTGVMSFENGQMVVNGTQYYNDQLQKIFDKYPPKEVSSSLLNRLPSGAPLGAMVFNIPIEGLNEVLKIAGIDGLANMFLGKSGTTLEDISKAFTGEFAAAVSSVTSKLDSSSYQDSDGKTQYDTRKKTEPEYVVGIGIKDKPTFDKLYNLLLQESGGETPKDVVIKNEKGWFVISNSEANANAFIAGTNKPAYSSKIQGHSFGFFVDFQQIMNSIQAESSREPGENKSLELSKKTWQDAIAFSDYKKKNFDFKFEVNMIDKSTNSLKQLNSFIDQLYVISEEEKAKRISDYSPVDTIPPAVVSPEK